MGIDGSSGSGTETGLRNFQTAMKITATGKTDDATWRKLLRL